MSQLVDDEQFKEMLANYMDEGEERAPATKTGKQQRRQPRRPKALPKAQQQEVTPLTLSEQVDASIARVRKGVDPRKVARRLLRG